MVEETSSESTKKRKGKSEAWEWLKALGVAVVLALFIRTFLFAPFLVDGSSMMPTLENGERLIVNKLIYYIQDPKPGDIVVFHATREKDYIKRVIATEGQTVEVRNDQLYIDGKPVDESYLKQYKEEARAAGYVLTEDFGPEKVPPGHIFVMGDNRRNSTDSRVIGPVPVKSVVGRSELIIWPLDKIRLN
ncbi:signal peptidase I [Aneurinibacillus thermoaerophilus]|uniref:Signal peptidase I n=1 Tax=Aneurinibacillus thermoaerophilus TaxID=143495 RepID=A0A1G7WD77_ANETH|nr:MULTISPECIES: signal peptidase I [Aneurinibacillus]AMA72646.1 S26 family signal peptidase [Aneurinibacillus sp. XH2]MED0674637.1 signal peptidase I [Aneurinibacillus thermoaerophilus]MED0678006.1 signal peptidase I [Aneurinibacillus thermoaerophilus]MED0756772.1 signal peptidase I [Aneurinibacillus thermoaerophilus]MED0760822.1 signal peptidase I [Aneurinibacillus thermoaerophilus]